MKRKGMLVTFGLIFAVLIIGFFFPNEQSNNQQTISGESEDSSISEETQQWDFFKRLVIHH